ncbi:tetratricopeptide repeat protein, partial [Clostridium perfringens]
MRHIPIIETEPITNPPSTEYERGKWYKRRGYLEKALKSFKEAAQSTPTDKASSGWKEVDLSWLEYGLL